MKRREFITFLGSTVIAWPLAALAQQGGAMRRIGVLMNAADDPESTTPTSASDSKVGSDAVACIRCGLAGLIG